MQGLDGLGAGGDVEDLDALGGAAVLLPDDDLLGDVHQAAGQVTGVGSTQGGVGQALSGAAGGDEVFQNVQALAVVGLDGNLDGLTGGVGDQAAHAGQLADLVHGASGAGVRHHVDGVVAVQALLQGVGDIVGALFPGAQHGVVALRRRTGSPRLYSSLISLISASAALQQVFLLRGDGGVAHSHGDAADGGVLIALGLDLVQHLGGLLGAVDLDAVLDDLAQLLFAHQEVDLELQGVLGGGAVHIAQVLGDGAVEDHAAHGGLHQAGDGLAVEFRGAADPDFGVQADALWRRRPSWPPP